QIPGAYPRAWAVHEVRTIERDDQIGPQIDASDFDPRRQAFVKGPAPSVESCEGPEQVALVARVSDRVSLETNLRCRGMVIQSDTYFPGWVATVDGQTAQLYEAYGFLRGVIVGPGRHKIELCYRPKSVYWGAAMTMAGLLGACLLTRVEW